MKVHKLPIKDQVYLRTLIKAGPNGHPIESKQEMICVEVFGDGSDYGMDCALMVVLGESDHSEIPLSEWPVYNHPDGIVTYHWLREAEEEEINNPFNDEQDEV